MRLYCILWDYRGFIRPWWSVIMEWQRGLNIAQLIQWSNSLDILLILSNHTFRFLGAKNLVVSTSPEFHMFHGSSATQRHSHFAWLPGESTSWICRTWFYMFNGKSTSWKIYGKYLMIFSIWGRSVKIQVWRLSYEDSWQFPWSHDRLSWTWYDMAILL